MFAPKKTGSLHFCVEYQNWNAVTKREVTRYDVWRNVSIRPESLLSIQRIAGTVRPGMTRSKREIEKRQPSLSTNDCIALCGYHLDYGMF